MYKTPGTAKGSGRAGVRRSSAKPSMKRSTQGLFGMKRGLQHISKNDIKRLARRAGVVRISELTYVPAYQALCGWLRSVLGRVVPLVEHGRRFTVMPNDVAYALKQMGCTLYMKGADWTYGFYSHSHVRARIMPPIAANLLAAAAARRTSSEAASVQGVESAAAAVEQQAAAEEVASGLQLRFAAAAAEAAEKQREQQPEQQPEPTASAVSVARVAEQAEQQQQQATAAQLQSPAVQQAAAGVPDVPTPIALTEARALLIQGWMSDWMTSRLQAKGYVSQWRLKQAMADMHGCAAAEVQDVLFALERMEKVMLDGDHLYLTS